MNDQKPKDELSELSSNIDNQNQEDPYFLLEEFLMNQPKEIQRQVRKTVEIWGISKDDPYFLILIQCRITQILYQETPSQIQKAFEVGNAAISKVLEHHEQRLLDIYEQQLKRQEEYSVVEFNHSMSKLNSAIAKVLEENNLSSRKSRFSPRVVGSVVTAGAVFISLFLGSWGAKAFDSSSVALSWKKNLEAQEKVLLEWAKSEEGQFAKNIVEWNEDLVGKDCQKAVKDLGISFRIGTTEATTGFCVVFVEPPSKRNYK